MFKLQWYRSIYLFYTLQSGMIMTEEEKKQMPATRQKTSILAVGCNLVLSEDKPEQAASVKRSGPCQASAHTQ